MKGKYIHCSLLVGKSRVSPNKFLSISRLELAAVVLSVKMACLIMKKLNLQNTAESFWKDSLVVLAYIRSNTKRFKFFVANWVQNIQEHSDVNQWNYVKGKGNPADDASRGLDPRNETLSRRWFTGHPFLWQTEKLWPSYSEVTCVGDDDPEIKMEVKVNPVQLMNDVLQNVEKRVSNWCKLKRIIALVLIYLRGLLLKGHRKILRVFLI